MQMAGKTETHEELASRITDTALFVLQTRQLTSRQQQTLVSFLHDTVDLTLERVQHVVQRELHPKFRNVLSFEERVAFEGAIFNNAQLRMLESESESKVEEIRSKYAENWSVESLSDFMGSHGQELSLSLIEVLLSLVRDESEPSRRHMQLLRIYEVCQLIGIDKWLASSFFYKYGFFSSAGNGRLNTHDDELILIGSGGACDLVLFDPRVEPLHAYIQKEDGKLVLLAEQSKRPVWYKDVPVQRMVLSLEDKFQIGSVELTVERDSLALSEPSTMLTLSVQDIQRKIGAVTLLEDVNFSIFGGELIALIGPSGCGKTTLLNAINGVAPADSGRVMLNGHSFHKLLQDDRSLIGIVPQDDLVLPELTVEEALYYSGRLRLSADSTEDEIQSQVERVLQELDILHIRSSRIGDALKRGISGGQRKRVNLGQELLSQNTKILFLDEPTSGLDPRASQEIVKLVRGLADRGRIVFLVTHDLTDGIINQVDNLLAMVKGGKIAFFGKKNDALEFFQVPTTDKIFQQFGEDQSKWSSQFKTRTDYNVRQLAIDNCEVSETEPPTPPRNVGRFHTFKRQFTTLIERYFKVKLRDTTGMAVLALQPPFLATVIWIVFQEEGVSVPTESMLFMLALSCLWFGMSAAVRELISDQVIFRRERRVGVGVLPYVLSKVFVLGAIVSLQTMFLTGSMYWLMNMGDAESYNFILSDLLMVSTLTGLVGMALGLFVSSLWKSSEAAVGFLPIILIPNIAFSSLVFAIRDMGWVSKAVTWVVIQRYTFDAFLKCGEKIAVRSRRGDFEPQLINGTLWKLGLKMSDEADDIGLTLFELNWILFGIAMFLLVLTYLRVVTRKMD